MAGSRIRGQKNQAFALVALDVASAENFKISKAKNIERPGLAWGPDFRLHIRLWTLSAYHRVALAIAAFGAPGDVLICLTTSGKSKNVKRAGRSESAPTETIALLGCDGGSTIGMADVDFLIRSNSTTRALEAHPASSLCGVPRGM